MIIFATRIIKTKLTNLYINLRARLNRCWLRRERDIAQRFPEGVHIVPDVDVMATVFVQREDLGIGLLGAEVTEECHQLRPEGGGGE